MNQQMNMAGMNATGAPGGGTPLMNSGGPRGEPNSNRTQLNTYIYDYFLKNHHYELARAVSRELPISATPQAKTSPGGRDVNGVDESMDTDSKDDGPKRPSDLPVPTILDHTEGSFLFDWWCQFWDIWSAHRRKVPPAATASQYLAHAQQTSRMRQDVQRRMLQDQSLGPQYRNMMQQNGMVMQNELAKRAMVNNRNANPQLQQYKNMQQHTMMQANMQRDGSGMDMVGQRPQSPVDSAPSPKRQRLEGNAFNGQAMGPAGRGQPPNMQGQPMPNPGGQGGNPNQLLLQNGLNQGQIPQNQFEAFQASTPHVQAKSLEGMNGGGMPQASPMGQPGPDGQMEFYSGNGQMRGMPGAPGQAGGGTHALQDYQMQLMLLEQQNKKRLLMARQEQDNQQAHGIPGSAPQAGFAPTMSPQGSRAGGPSPNPSEQMKRGTPKMGQSGLPPSPLPDQNRGSPAPNFDPSQMPPGSIPPQFYPQMAANGAMMRPPSSHPGFAAQMNHAQMEAIARQNGGRMPNGIWPQGPPQPMMQQPQGQQPAQVGTPQQRNSAMPPPPAPPAGVEPGRTQPPSPSQQPAQPPTPSQTTKPAPKTKKDAKDNRKKPPKKAAATTGATPASEAEPPTPTPSTPITPMHPNSFNTQKNGATQPANVQPPAPAPVSAPPVAPPQMDANAGAPFAGLDASDNAQFGLEFAGLDSQDVLENFDFDSFLHTDDNTNTAHWDLMNFGGTDAVEAGTGDV